MSGQELEQLETILVRALPDPRGFVDQVFKQLLERLGGDVPTTRVVAVAPSTARDVVDRDLVLAAALGACECWGRDQACTTCGGDGAPGWTDPDEDLYVEYVRPAAKRRAAIARSMSMNGRPDQAAPTEGIRL